MKNLFFMRRGIIMEIVLKKGLKLILCILWRRSVLRRLEVLLKRVV